MLVAALLAAGCSSEPADSGSDSGKPVDATADVPPARDVATDAARADTACADCPVDGSGGDSSDDVDTSDAGDAPDTVGARCFSEIAGGTGPDYDQFAPTIASHCYGTDHQDIEGVERVVVLGDSVTVGTPNSNHPDPLTDNSHYYRNLLAEWLADRFDLDKGDMLLGEWGQWKAVDSSSGTGVKKHAGDFWHCAEWGARTDDFLEGGNQVEKCFPDGGSDETTLVVFTMGGNDVNKFTQQGGKENEEKKAREIAERAIRHLRDTVEWLTDSQRFPNGSYVVFANPFEFTDGTGDVDSCPAANLASYEDWDDPQALEDITIWFLEQYMKIAVETQTDMIWMLEHFCGHGFVATGPDADPTNQCYRGPDAERWFDETCIHPNETGHKKIAEMFKAVVRE